MINLKNKEENKMKEFIKNNPKIVTALLTMVLTALLGLAGYKLSDGSKIEPVVPAVEAPAK